MHVISKKKLKKFWEKHPDAKTNLESWYKITSKIEWGNFVELRQTFPSADLVANFTVFNICGNKYRLIVLVDYQYKEIYIRHVLTHAEYDTDNWKNDPWYT
ncbi:type II toxin-antitoxin system HigB family toxin [Floridanema evergladense]|uniref:Type II toxin-antitoxin system HigB family toxin n=1 Tax=Floridaenema evergladense BLCC-F167 TaxID=3153639 RepID=A0ABV4WDX6_9CYAN